MKNNIAPHVYVLSTLAVVVVSILVLNIFGLNDLYVLTPVLALAVVYSAVNFARQHRGLSIFFVDKKPNYPKLIKKSIARYFVWLIIIATAYLFYSSEPYYSTDTYRMNTVFFEYLLKIYVVAGLPYFFITGIFKASRIEDYYDPAVRLIHMSKQFFVRILRGDNASSVGRVFVNKYNRKVLLNLVMRTYFIPVMVVQIYTNMTYSLLYTSNDFYGFDVLAIMYWITTSLWLMDVINASLSYGIESRWIENRSRSIDMTFSGWAVCLMCYAPLNNVTGELFFFAPNLVTHNTADLVIENIHFLYIAKGVEIFLLACHIYTDVSLGPSIANITLKKLQTRGFYGLVRHPGTTLKLAFWLTQSVIYKGFWNVKVIGHFGMWAIIYALRALTEERHLSHYEEYRAYRQKVKHRFIPKIF